VYIGSSAPNANFARYNPATNTATYLKTRLTDAGYPAANATDALVYDSFNHTVYVGGSTANADFARYDPDRNFATYLRQKLIDAGWPSTSKTDSFAFDAFNHVIYIGSSSNNADFARFDTFGDKAVYLREKLINASP